MNCDEYEGTDFMREARRMEGELLLERYPWCPSGRERKLFQEGADRLVPVLAQN